MCRLVKSEHSAGFGRPNYPAFPSRGEVVPRQSGYRFPSASLWPSISYGSRTAATGVRYLERLLLQKSVDRSTIEPGAWRMSEIEHIALTYLLELVLLRPTRNKNGQRRPIGPLMRVSTLKWSGFGAHRVSNSKRSIATADLCLHLKRFRDR